ncbi:hypothetical protein ABES02_29785 [Neobacillus pocheonensis]|uniref:hypothetical protein n=1 Tax=Neobacillus pocheonensis TaxID=363869 RepID=UPI003D2B444B
MGSSTRSKKKKVRGIIGRVRLYLFTISTMLHLILQVVISFAVACLIALVVARFWGTNAALSYLLPCCLLVFVLYNTFGSRFVIVRDGYYMRPITSSEYDLYAGRNLIHYTDYLSVDDIKHYEATNTINLIAHGSKRSNYSMRSEDRAKRFIWFHLSDGNGTDEPDFDSFWTSHFTESSPRTYKFVLPANTFSKEQIYIRPFDKAIAVEGDYVGPIHMMTAFPWYNKKIYFLKSMHFPYKDSLLFWFIVWLQICGNIADFLDKFRKQ